MCSVKHQSNPGQTLVKRRSNGAGAAKVDAAALMEQDGDDESEEGGDAMEGSSEEEEGGASGQGDMMEDDDEEYGAPAKRQKGARGFGLVFLVGRVCGVEFQSWLGFVLWCFGAQTLPPGHISYMASRGVKR